MIASFIDPLRALLFALGGAGLAWVWTQVSPWAALGIVAVIFIVSWVLSKVGEGYVGTDDRRAMRLMETRVVTLGIVTAAAGAIGILIAVQLAAPEGTAALTTKVLATVSGALVAFVTSLFVDADKADAAVGAYIAKVFQAGYVREGHGAPGLVELKVGSDAHLAVMSSTAFGLTDWTRENRRERLRYLLGEKGNGGRLG